MEDCRHPFYIRGGDCKEDCRHPFYIRGGEFKLLPYVGEVSAKQTEEYKEAQNKTKEVFKRPEGHKKTSLVLLFKGQAERAACLPFRAAIGGFAFDDVAFATYRARLADDAVIWGQLTINP